MLLILLAETVMICVKIITEASKLHFRKDINGLRAIAVLAVVLYHFGVPGFTGGFVGVDVFFVISGFLMTSIILNKTYNGKFSLIGFYLDRGRRIIPALSALCLALAVFGWFYLIPTDYNTLAMHIQSSALFYSNIEYFHSVNYFDALAKEKWLLHTWSLSVEWQFYLIYPVIILVGLKALGKKSIPYLLTTLFILSLALSCYMSGENKTAAFYLIYYRAWEMVAGGLLFFAPKKISAKYEITAKCIGVVLVGSSIYLFDESMSWPGYNAIAPVLGAMLIILSGNNGFFITDNKASQYLGKISYSVYLWHWPVVVYGNFMGYSGYMVTIASILTSVILGALSYYIVENPLRKALKLLSRLKALEISACAALAFIPYQAGAYVFEGNGVPSRFPFALITPEQLMKERARYWVDGDKLHPIPANGVKKIIIIGNSHGVDLTYAMITNGLKGDISYLRTTNMCSNFGYTPNSEKDRNYCTKVKDDVLNFPGLKDADIIIMHDNWKVENLIDMKKMLGELRMKTKAPIYVVGPKMTYNLSASEMVIEAMKEKNANPEMINSYSERYYDNTRAPLNDNLNEFFKVAGFEKFNIFYIDALSAQCGKELKCEIISKDKKFEYFDTNHFTLEGSTIFGGNLKKIHPEMF